MLVAEIEAGIRPKQAPVRKNINDLTSVLMIDRNQTKLGRASIRPMPLVLNILGFTESLTTLA